MSLFAVTATACSASELQKEAILTKQLNANSVSLFDGQSLSGWSVTEENPDSFKVENGAIVAHGPRAHLFYTGPAGNEFKDFELSLDVKTEQGSNSGVFFHTRYQKDDWPKYGLEAQINATQGDPRKTGSLYATADIRVYDSSETVAKLGVDSNPFVTLAAPPHLDDIWFEYVIRVEGTTVSTFIDGDLLVQWQQPKNHTDPTRRLSSGTFALQAHDPDSLVRFKNIKLNDLSKK